MATLKDVAKETGLTVSTVSRVLNNRGYISADARERVYEAMKRLNYQPNELARSLSKQTTNTIGVIVPHIDHPYFARLLSSLETAAYKSGYKLLLFNSGERDEKEDRYLEMCKGSRVAGIILCSGRVETQCFEGLGVPLVTVERFLESGTAAGKWYIWAEKMRKICPLMTERWASWRFVCARAWSFWIRDGKRMPGYMLPWIITAI